MLKSHRFWVAGVLVCFVFALCFPLFIQPGPSAQKALATLPGFPCYRTLDTVYTDAASLANAHPNLAQWLDIGDSWLKQYGSDDEGFDLNVLKLTNQNTDGDKPVLFVMSALHSRDLAPVELNLRFAEQLLSGYGSDPEVTWLLDEIEIHLLLVANPDGRNVVEEQIADGSGGGDGRQARLKNLNATTCPDPDNTGTDLQRNFPFQWQSSSSGCYDDYSGIASLPEPETAAIKNYLDLVFPDYREGNPFEPVDPNTNGVFINLISYGDIFTYPYFYNSDPAPEEAELYTMANKLAYGLYASPNQPATLLFGQPEDYIYAERGIPAITYAIGQSSQGKYFMNCFDFEAALAANLEMLIRAAKTTFSPYILPAGPEITGLSLQSHVKDGQTIWQLSAIARTDLYRLPSPPSPIVAAAAYSFDLAPWEEGAEMHPIQPADGSWNEAEEELVAMLDVTDLLPGQHRVYVQAFLQDGTAGLASVGVIEVEPEPMPTPTPIVGTYFLYLPQVVK